MAETPTVFTYRNQPGNVDASRMGIACIDASSASSGDYIDRGLVLLRELEAQGFGIVKLTDHDKRGRDG